MRDPSFPVANVGTLGLCWLALVPLSSWRANSDNARNRVGTREPDHRSATRAPRDGTDQPGRRTTCPRSRCTGRPAGSRIHPILSTRTHRGPGTGTTSTSHRPRQWASLVGSSSLGPAPGQADLAVAIGTPRVHSLWGPWPSSGEHGESPSVLNRARRYPYGPIVKRVPPPPSCYSSGWAPRCAC
jgi:hypothetical protein